MEKLFKRGGMNMSEMKKVEIAERLQKRKINGLEVLRLEFNKENHTLKISKDGRDAFVYDDIELLEDIYDCLEDYIIYG